MFGQILIGASYFIGSFSLTVDGMITKQNTTLKHRQAIQNQF